MNELNTFLDEENAISGTFFNIALEKSLINLQEKMNRIRPKIEH